MNRQIYIIYIMFATSVLSCDIDGKLPECNYNVMLSYSYTTVGGTNEINDYIFSATDYLFDADGLLAGIYERSGIDIAESRMSLPPGHYTLVRWGNRSDLSLLRPDTANQAVCRLSDCRLLQDNPAAGGTAQANADPLHYSRIELDVPPVGIVRKRVYQTHAYLHLYITVKGIEGNTGDNYTMRLDGTAEGTSFRTACTISAHNDLILIPSPLDDRTVPHIAEGCKMKKNGDIEGEFITARLTGKSIPLFSLWLGDQPVLADIDLKNFFDTMLIDMDTNECQEFRLRITYEDGKVYISFVSLGDWEDGGSFG